MTSILPSPRIMSVSCVAALSLLAGGIAPHPATPAFAPAASAGAQPRPILANVGFALPENLVYDARNDVYLISNMNGDPAGHDAKGFVSRVSSDGRLIALKWIDGSRAETRLDAPKGLAIFGDTLAIADVGCVRLFDLRTGTSLAVWNVPGVFMNDVSFAPDGTLYVTDTGPNVASDDTTEHDSPDHDAIFHFTAPNHPVAFATGDDLRGPDGLVASDTSVVYATFYSDRIVRATGSGERTTLATLPGGHVDGLRDLPDGSYVATSWDARAAFTIMPDGTITRVASGITAPSGVAYNPSRHQLAITSVEGNSMYLVTLH